VGRRIAGALGVPFVELDAVFWHQPGWVGLDRASFRAAVDDLTTEGGWVVDGNYSSAVQDIVWSRADTVVWLDLPKAVVMWQIICRSLGRVALRKELWNGNRERWGSLLTLDPEDSVIAWSWHQHARQRRSYERAMSDPVWHHLRFVRLRSRRHASRFVRHLEGHLSPPTSAAG
jgi:adenylate kinase family enzyme